MAASVKTIYGGNAMILVLASTSPYRKALLERLAVAFTVDSPGVDEICREHETADQLVERLSIEKAQAVRARHAASLIIGSDQVAVRDGCIVGKPGNHENNVTQLAKVSGRRLEFRTGVCLLNSATGRVQCEVVPFAVVFRRLSPAQIESYVSKERPFDCAGGFRAEGLGLALFQSMQGDDPTALMGLPLITLVRLLHSEGVDVLSSAEG